MCRRVFIRVARARVLLSLPSRGAPAVSLTISRNLFREQRSVKPVTILRFEDRGVFAFERWNASGLSHPMVINDQSRACARARAWFPLVAAIRGSSVAQKKKTCGGLVFIASREIVRDPPTVLRLGTAVFGRRRARQLFRKQYVMLRTLLDFAKALVPRQTLS